MADVDSGVSKRIFFANNVKSGTKSNNLKALILQSYNKESAINKYKLVDKYSIDKSVKNYFQIVLKLKFHSHYLPHNCCAPQLPALTLQKLNSSILL